MALLSSDCGKCDHLSLKGMPYFSTITVINTWCRDVLFRFCWPFKHHNYHNGCFHVVFPVTTRQLWFNAGSTFLTLTQHWIYIGLMSRLYWVSRYFQQILLYIFLLFKQLGLSPVNYAHVCAASCGHKSAAVGNKPGTQILNNCVQIIIWDAALQKAVTIHLKSKQLLPFCFRRQNWTRRSMIR